MQLSPTRQKFLVLSLFLIFIAAALTAGCMSNDNKVSAILPNTTPDVTVAPTMAPVVTEVITVPETTIAVLGSPTPVPEVTLPVTPSPLTAPELLTYTNKTYGFSINYPSDWQVTEAPVETGQDLGVPRGYSNKTDVVEFSSPGVSRCHHSDCVNVQAELHVEVDPSPPTAKPDEYFIKDVTALQRNYPLESTHNTMVRVATINAYRVDYRQNRDLMNIHVERVYAGLAGKVFVFTFHAHAPYSGEEDQYAKYSGTMETVFKSFEPIVSYRTL